MKACKFCQDDNYAGCECMNDCKDPQCKQVHDLLDAQMKRLGIIHHGELSFSKAACITAEINRLKSRVQHWGDCTFYSSIANGRPYDGICTCGYGWQLRTKGDDSQFISRERHEVERRITEAIIERQVRAEAAIGEVFKRPSK